MEIHNITGEFKAFQKGLDRGMVKVFRQVADWIEEDLREGRSLDHYPAVLRREANRYEALDASPNDIAY